MLWSSAKIQSEGCSALVSILLLTSIFVRDLSRGAVLAADGAMESSMKSPHFVLCRVQATISDVVPSRSCGSVEWHGACPSAGSFRVRLEGPATLWGEFSIVIYSPT